MKYSDSGSSYQQWPQKLSPHFIFFRGDYVTLVLLWMEQEDWEDGELWMELFVIIWMLVSVHFILSFPFCNHRFMDGFVWKEFYVLLYKDFIDDFATLIFMREYLIIIVFGLGFMIVQEGRNIIKWSDYIFHCFLNEFLTI